MQQGWTGTRDQLAAELARQHQWRPEGAQGLAGDASCVTMTTMKPRSMNSELSLAGIVICMLTCKKTGNGSQQDRYTQDTVTMASTKIT